MNLVKVGSGYRYEGDPNKIRWSINDVEMRILSELFVGKTVLEIGTGPGVSTRAIAKVAKFVHTVDVEEWVRDNIVPMLPENTKFYLGIENFDEKVDVAFIDGDHSFQACLKDIDTCRKYVKEGGMILIHDIFYAEVRDAISFSKLNCYEMKTGIGLGIAWNDKV